ncbi:MAG: MFS transporter [Candidatus Hodarchaeales archaeon]
MNVRKALYKIPKSKRESEVSSIGKELDESTAALGEETERVSAFKELRNLNYNAKLLLIITFFQSLGRGIWGGNLLSAYIFYLGNESNELLGLTSAVGGLAMTLFVLPSGFLSDRFRRDYVIKAASVVGFFAILMVYLSSDILGIFMALVIWGAFQGLWRPSTDALFADSIESGKRSKIYTYRHIIRQIGMAAGPFLNVALFLILGDTWELAVLRNVILMGLLLSTLGLTTMWFVDDDRSLGAKSEAIGQNSRDKSSDLEEISTLTNGSWKKPVSILLTCNLIIGMGAGMTIRFFPIFFIEVYDWLPIAVNFVMGIVALATATTSFYAQRASQKRGYGRVWMIFIVQGLAILCLITLVSYPPVWILVPVFVARGSLMNASQPLSRSILMDQTPSKYRGVINSGQAMAWGLFWNMSAAVGGFLIGFGGYQLVFIITAGVYIVGTLPILLLLPYVPRETGEKARRRATKDFPALETPSSSPLSRMP